MTMDTNWNIYKDRVIHILYINCIVVLKDGEVCPPIKEFEKVFGVPEDAGGSG